jgi:hypothetical protein
VAGSARVGEDVGEGGSDDGALDPAFEALRVLLGEDALAGGVRDRDATGPEGGEERPGFSFGWGTWRSR